MLTFQRENVRLGEREREELAGSDVFASMVDLAQTTVYDTRVIAASSTPSAAVIGSGVPMLIMRGEPALPVFVSGCPRLASMVPGAELVVVPESHDHGVDPEGTVRAVLEHVP